MEKDIQDVIDKAIKEDWYNELTTSDLQGVCEAESYRIIKKHNTSFSLWDNKSHIPIMEVSDKILQGIYDHVEG